MFVPAPQRVDLGRNDSLVRHGNAALIRNNRPLVYGVKNDSFARNLVVFQGLRRPVEDVCSSAAAGGPRPKRFACSAWERGIYAASPYSFASRPTAKRAR